MQFLDQHICPSFKILVLPKIFLSALLKVSCYSFMFDTDPSLENYVFWHDIMLVLKLLKNIFLIGIIHDDINLIKSCT